jgi:hypothetical protein
MKRIGLGLALCITLLTLATSCATTSVEYEEGFSLFKSGSEVNILLARAVPQLTVLIDDKIVVDSRVWGTRRVDIQSIPEGQHTIKMFANSWQLKENFSYEEKFDLRKNAKKPIMVQVPQYSTMYWIYVIGIAIVSALPSVVVYY